MGGAQGAVVYNSTFKLSRLTVGISNTPTRISDHLSAYYSASHIIWHKVALSTDKNYEISKAYYWTIQHVYFWSC